MGINRIRQFRAVFETGSIREAATYLNMSPGALSKSVKSLEQEFDLELFVQKGRNIVSTDSARDFYHKSEILLQAYEELVKISRSYIASSMKTLKIASWEVFTSYFIGEISEVFFPYYDIVALERVPGHLEKSILEGEADIGITYAPIPHADLTILRVASFENEVFARSGAFVDGSVSDIPFSAPITQVLGSPSGVKTLDCWPVDIPRKIKYKVQLLETGLENCRRGLSAIYCPKFVVHLQNKHATPLKPLKQFSNLRHEKQNIYLVFRKASKESKDIKLLAKAIRIIARHG